MRDPLQATQLDGAGYVLRGMFEEQRRKLREKEDLIRMTAQKEGISTNEVRAERSHEPEPVVR